MIVVLSLTGTRASEHTDLVWALIDHTHGRIVVEDSKSDAGVREIHMSPFVREEVALYKASLLEDPKPKPWWLAGGVAVEVDETGFGGVSVLAVSQTTSIVLRVVASQCT
jgi:hypothetical protein